MGRGKIAALVVGVVVAGSALGAGVIVIVNGGFSMKSASETATEKYFDQKDAEASSAAATASATWAQYVQARQTVETACENAVRNELVSPTTAQFAVTGTPDSTLNYIRSAGTIDGRIQGTVDSQNSYGAMVRSDWGCVVADKSSAAAPSVTVTSLDQRHG